SRKKEKTVPSKSRPTLREWLRPFRLTAMGWISLSRCIRKTKPANKFVNAKLIASGAFEGTTTQLPSHLPASVTVDVGTMGHFTGNRSLNQAIHVFPMGLRYRSAVQISAKLTQKEAYFYDRSRPTLLGYRQKSGQE